MGKHEGMTKVTILTGAYRITGYVDLVPGARITDFMQEAKQFVAVTNAEVITADATGRHVMNAAFIDVNRDRIEIVTPG